MNLLFKAANEKDARAVTFCGSFYFYMERSHSQDECACLESTYTLMGIQGSNPCLSASLYIDAESPDLEKKEVDNAGTDNR